MMEVKTVSQMEQDQDRNEFWKVALSSSLLFFMCFFGLLFDKVNGVYTYPFYDASCDCLNLEPVKTYSISIKWIIKDISIFIYSIVICLVSLIRPNFNMFGNSLYWMWLVFFLMLPVDYLLSYETAKFRLIIEIFVCLVQVIYTANYGWKVFVKGDD